MTDMIWFLRFQMNVKRPRNECDENISYEWNEFLSFRLEFRLSWRYIRLLYVRLCFGGRSAITKCLGGNSLLMQLLNSKKN